MNKQHKGCYFHEQDSAVLFLFSEILFNIYGDKGRYGTVAKSFDAVSKYIHLAVCY